MDDTQALECTQALADDWDNEEGDPKEQSLVAWLEVGGSRYDIHLGETMIGRDPVTCKIVLENKVLSKQHAVIEVDKDMHTIADLGSMNKTRIGKMILKPNVRFALQGGESLRFGDVQAKYIIIPKIQNDDSGSETESESMFLLDDSGEKPASPVLSHHLPGLDTTKRECTTEGDEGTSSDLSDFIPQTPVTVRSNSVQCDSTSMKSFVPESPSSSQIMPLCQKSAKLTVPESPDNTSPIKNLGEDKEDSFFFDPSQPPKEKQVCKTQATPTTVGKEGLQTEGYNSDASTDIEEDDVPTQLFSDIHDSTSETDLKLYKNKEDTVKSIDRDMSDSGINLSKDNSKSSDDVGQASTEFDDDIFNQPTQAFPVSDKSLKVTRNIDINNMSPSFEKDTDSTQEIMDAFKMPIVKSNVQSNVTHDDDDTDDETMLPTQPFVATENPSCSRAQEMNDDIPTQLFFGIEEEAVFKKPFAMAPKSKKNVTESLTDRCNKTLDLFNESTNEDILDAPTQPFSSDEQTHSVMACKNDGILDAPILPFDEPGSCYNFQLQNKAVQNEKYGAGSASASAADDDDIFDQPTQPYSVLKDAEVFEEETPTQYFEPTPINKILKKEDKHDDKEESDDEIDIFNMPTQMYSTPKANSHVEHFVAKNGGQSKNGGIGSKRSIGGTCLNLSPVSVKGRASVYIDDDDLPPTQIFTSPSLSNKLPVLSEVDDDDDVAPTQPFVNEDTKANDVSNAGTLKVPENSEHLDEVDFDAPTQIFQEKPINKELDEYDAPTQLFSDIGDKLSAVTPQKLLPGESKKDSRELPQGISQTWGILDADATQDIFLASVLGIDKPCSDTTLQKDKFNDTDINNSASDTSEPLLNPVEIENVNDDIPLSLKTDKDNNHSPKKSASQGDKEEEREKILKDLGVDNLEIKKRKMSKTCTNKENEGYNSDESTDIENELETPDKVLKPTVNVDNSRGSEMSHLELSSESNAPENRDCMTPSSMTYPNSSFKEENNAASSPSSLAGPQKSHAEASGRDQKPYQFKRVSKMAAVAKTSPVTICSTEPQSTQDSCTLIDESFTIVNLPDSEDSVNHETVFVKLQTPRNKGMLSDGHMLSDSESEDGNFSQRLFDLPLEFEDLKTKKSQAENMGQGGDEGSVAKEMPERKGSNTDQEINKRNVDDAEEKNKVQENKNERKMKTKINKTKVEIKDADKEEISKDQTMTTKSVSGIDSNSENDSSPLLSLAIRNQNTNLDVGTLQTSNFESNANLDCRRKSKRKVEYNDKSGNKSEEIGESPTKKMKNRIVHRLKNKVDIEETQLECKTHPNTTKTYLEKDDSRLSMIVEGEASEMGVVTPSGLALSNTGEEQKIQNKKPEIIETYKKSLRGPKIMNKNEEHASSLPVRDKRKSGTSKIKHEPVTGKRGTRTKCKELASESLSIDSSTSMDSASEVTIDDVQNIRRSGRRRNNSDSSTVSNLSIGSNMSVPRSAAATTSRLADPIMKGRSGKAAAGNETDLNILPRIVGEEIELKTSKSKFVPKLRDRNKENKVDKKPDLVIEKSSTKSGFGTDSSRTRGSRRSRIPDPPVAESDENKTRTRTTNINMDDSVLEVNIEKTDKTLIKKPEVGVELKKLENSTHVRGKSNRTRKEPKRFSPEQVKTQASQETSIRSSGRIRKSDISEIIGEHSKALPVKRGRKSAMPNLCVSKSSENDEEVEIVARQKSVQGTSAVIEDSKAKKGNVQIVKRGCRSTTAKPSVLQKEKESLQEADIQINKTGQALTSQTSRKTRANIDTSHLATKEDIVVAKKPRSSMIAENTKGKDIRNSLESKNMSRRGKRTQNLSTKERNAQEDNSEVAGKLQVPEMDIAKRGKQRNRGLSKDNSEDETSSQSSEDSHLSQRSKRKRGNDNSMDQLLSTPKSSRSGRSRLGSPSSKDNILWSPSQRQQQASTKPRVLFTGYVDTQDVKIVTDFGGTVVECPRECTVLVTINIRRTCKLLAVIGRGLPIVSPAWLSASKRARNFVDPWEYLVKDTESEEKYGFQLEQSLRSASKVLLFEGLSIHATRSVKPPPDQMKEIIECSGGEYLDMPPKKYAPQVRIVSCPEDKKLWPAFKHLGIPLLGTEFILTGLLRHELLLDEFPLG